MVTRLPRYINPASIQLGDTIRVSWETGDTKRTITGTVARREYYGSVRVLTTADGHELLRWLPSEKSPRVTLLSEGTPEPPTPLFEIPDVRQRI